MRNTTKILWSGITGRTGVEAIEITNSREDIEIVAGLRREICGGIDYESAIDFSARTGYTGKWYRYRDLNNLTKPQPQGFDALVDFSDESCFEQVVTLAVRTHVPLISGTPGLSNRQMATLYDATSQIPIFRGGNFRFKVKKFIDEAVEFAKRHDELILRETHWIGQPLPSETAKETGRKIAAETGKIIQIVNWSSYSSDSLINEWTLSGDSGLDHGISCKTIGFSELAHDVLEIAKAMKRKPIKKGEFYDLDEIWNDIPAEAKTTV